MTWAQCSTRPLFKRSDKNLQVFLRWSLVLPDAHTSPPDHLPSQTAFVLILSHRASPSLIFYPKLQHVADTPALPRTFRAPLYFLLFRTRWKSKHFWYVGLWIRCYGQGSYHFFHLAEPVGNTGESSKLLFRLYASKLNVFYQSTRCICPAAFFRGESNEESEQVTRTDFGVFCR